MAIGDTSLGIFETIGDLEWLAVGDKVWNWCVSSLKKIPFKTNKLIFHTNFDENLCVGIYMDVELKELK